MTYKILSMITLTLFTLSACDTPPPSGEAQPTKIIGFAQDAPPNAPSNSCWGKTFSPAVIETVKRNVLVKKAQINADGSIKEPAVYKTKTAHEIVQPRQETWFETVCPNVLTEEFIASLQRALTARGSYRADITGLMDERTRRAIRKFQKGDGFGSGNLTVASARALGLIAVTLE